MTDAESPTVICHGEAYQDHPPSEMYESTETINAEEQTVYRCSLCRHLIEVR